MSKIEVYKARKGKQIQEERLAAAVAGGATAAAVSPFTIEVRFLGGLTEGQKSAFRLAANRWSNAIVGDLPSVLVDGEVVDDVLILAQGATIDGVGNILGQAGPSFLRPPNAGAAAFLPAKGEMTFDSSDLADMEANGTLNDVITHEMGHVLGIGTVWTHKRLLRGTGRANPTFTGPEAMQEYGNLVGAAPRRVPVENHGGAGTRDSHWREAVFGNELMTGFVGDAPNPLSRLTIASLSDLGYEVDFGAAEAYGLPSPHLVAEAGAVLARDMGTTRIVLPRIPIILQEESLR